MSIKEVFPNPTVKKVIFQVTFPSLFAIESKIGDFQQKIMSKFPESSLLHRQSVLFTDVGQDGKLLSPPPNLGESMRKIWQFRSPKKYILDVLFDSLDIFSQYHKTYNNNSCPNRFRDIILFVWENFTELFRIPKLNRIGLRYIDECPIPGRNNDKFEEYYNSVLPLDRFPLKDIQESVSRTVFRKGNYFVTYVETFRMRNKKYTYGLDFDGFAKNVDSHKCLETTDKLHDIITEEYQKTIKEPVKQFMRNAK